MARVLMDRRPYSSDELASIRDVGVVIKEVNNFEAANFVGSETEREQNLDLNDENDSGDTVSEDGTEEDLPAIESDSDAGTGPDKPESGRFERTDKSS